MSEITSRYATIEGMRVHWREGGEGPPLLLLHGWPTSSLLWRRILPALTPHRRVIAPDLPGFGQSDKPADGYGYRFYQRVLEGLCDAAGVGETLGLVVHDMGGPVGLYWASQTARRLDRLALLNTLVYPEVDWRVKAFIAGARAPGLGALLVSGWGLGMCMKGGVADASVLDAETLEGVRAPFRTAADRAALRRSLASLGPGGLVPVAAWIRSLTIPVRVVYGVHDRALPDVARTVARLQADLPQAEVTALAHCGHFLQEEDPQRVGQELAAFFAVTR